MPADEIEDLKKHIPDERAHARHLGQGAQTLVRPPGGGPVELDRWLPWPQDVSMNGSDPVTEFAGFLENAGLVLKELPVMDGKNPPCPDRR